MTISSGQKKNFGYLADGQEVEEIHLVNSSGITMTVINYGCTITSLKLPDRHGVFDDVVLGFDTLEGYLSSNHYMGAVIGRCAGRIGNAQFTLDGKAYSLTANAGSHHLHGGYRGLDKVVWTTEVFENEKGVGVDFQYFSPDGEEGYPGNILSTVRYYLTHNNALIINYLAKTDSPTIFNPTQHTYWNLQGGGDTILRHALQIKANQYLPLTSSGLPNGAYEDVEDTPFDFRNPKLIHEVFDTPTEQIRIGQGLDHCWVMNTVEDELTNGGLLYDPASGRLVSFHSTLPGLQVYTGNALDGKGKKGAEYGPFSGICLETQYFPDTPHHHHFPSIRISPEKDFQATTVFQFFVIE